MYKRDIIVVSEEADDLSRLVLAHEPGVDEDAGELIADRFVDQHRGHRRVDPAGEAADHPALAHSGANPGDRLVLEAGHAPVALQARDPVREVAIDPRAPRRVDHLGMELHAETA